MTLGHKLWNLCGKFWVYAYHQSFVTASPHSFHIPMSMGDPLLLDFHHLMVMKLGDWCCPWLFVCGSCLIRHFCTSLYLNAFASGVKTVSKICACCWVIIAYFRLARKNSVLHPCLTVQYCQYFYQCLCLQLVSASLVCDFQVHYEWWRKILKYFWMSVVVYTMLVLIFIYTYQFESFPGLWKNMTGLDESK